MKFLFSAALIILIFAQWLVPLNMIKSSEDILKHGKLFHFQTQPVDPSTPFIGKYVWLNFEATTFTSISKDSFSSGEHIYVSIINDSNGFAKIADVSKSKPSINDYIEATCLYTNKSGDTLSVNIQYPFTKFYMDEYKAPKAQAEFGNAIDSAQKAYAIVSVLDGKAMIKDVIINNHSLKDIVQKAAK